MAKNFVTCDDPITGLPPREDLMVTWARQALEKRVKDLEAQVQGLKDKLASAEWELRNRVRS